MATFSATDAAFSGFTLARSRPRVFLIWGLVLLAVSLVTSTVTILTVGQALTDLQATSQSNDQEAAARSLLTLAPYYVVALLLTLLYYGVATAAVNRMVLRPDDSRNAFIRLGGDEGRMVIVMVVQWLIGVGVVIAAMLLTGLLAGVASAAGGAVAGVIVGIVAGVAGVALALLVSVRLSLALSQTFATGRVNIFGSWALTKGNFWPILGAYLLAIILLIVTYLLAFALMSVVAIAIGGGLTGVTSLFQPDMSTLASFFTPVMIVYSVIGGFLSALAMMVMYAPAATIYREIAQPLAADVFS
ncbi:MAG: hypothetical protein Q8J89_16685 [Caulobacter sp.]|nr:hypothetical protein [Caulobacter sp.]